MVSTRTLLKKVLNVKDIVVTGTIKMYSTDSVWILRHARLPVSVTDVRTVEENVPATTELAEDTVFGEVWTLAEQ